MEEETRLFSGIGSTLHPLLARIDISTRQREDKQDSRQTQVGRTTTDKSGRQTSWTT
jgi:hypothetical protein